MYISDTKIHWWILQETYAIEDIYDYDLTLYNDHQWHINTVSIPSGDFEVTFITMKNSSNRGGGVRYGTDSQNCIDIACTGISELENNSWKNVNLSNSYVPINTEVTIKYTYIDGVHSYYVNDVFKVSFTKVKTGRGWARISDNDTYIKDVKIKAL